jgi:hypothetical protein
MPTTVVALNLLIFLLPGFLIQRIVESLSVTGKISDTIRVVDALAFSLVNYLLYSILALPFGLRPIPLTLGQDGQLQFTGRDVSGFIILFSIAVFIGLLYAKSLNAGWHYRILRDRLDLTRKTGRVDLWHDIFSDYRGRWVEAHLKDGTRILGWPDYYSDDPDKRELFLAEAVVTKPDGTTYEVAGPGILLTEKSEIERIEILVEKED